MSNNEKAPEPTFFQVAKAVMSAFIGIRKKSDLENDAANLKPAHVIIGGLIGAMIFVVSILLLVKIVVQ
ncbi:Protein of unknown function [Nitrosomonas aestuarii]|uniref:DUF2970 domain-containing protein n=1 Tax=Nitrosomonas aestuarii TaxID=52441 RepID=A0A1I4EPE7_9PROT|nr:DUF2970 domain-containing protein [Nitrosomonas aestuarii]SFL06346.1 Protein of unknown function [Nitrosomonas aestuarii]